MLLTMTQLYDEGKRICWTYKYTLEIGDETPVPYMPGQYAASTVAGRGVPREPYTEEIVTMKCEEYWMITMEVPYV